MNSLHYPLHIDDDENLEQEILKPFNYHTSDSNQSIKQNLLKLLGGYLNVPEDKLEIISETIQYIYNGSFLLDDMQDNSILRRGKPTTYTVYGYPRTIIANNWTYVMICKSLEKLDNVEVTTLLAKTLPKLLAGQGLEIHWREKNTCPTEAEYLQMIYLKVSQVFLLLGKVMCVFSTTHKNLDVEKLLTTLGIHFQIQDDYKNLCDQMYFDSKGFCEDLSEGKFGFPLVHAINNFPKEGAIIQDILHQRTYDVKEKIRCLSLLEDCGSFEYTEKKLQELKAVIFEEIKKFDDNIKLKQFLETTLHAYL